MDMDIKIVHISVSKAIINYSKSDFANGCRSGIVMYVWEYVVLY